MVVFIMPKNLTSERTPKEIQNDIEDIAGFNVKCEHSKKWNEFKTIVIDEDKLKSEIIKVKAEKRKFNASDMAKSQRMESPKIIIHPDVKKANGETLTIDDIQEHHSFGNGVTTHGLKTIDGEIINCNWVVFPHSQEGIVLSKLAQLKDICFGS